MRTSNNIAALFIFMLYGASYLTQVQSFALSQSGMNKLTSARGLNGAGSIARSRTPTMSKNKKPLESEIRVGTTTTSLFANFLPDFSPPPRITAIFLGVVILSSVAVINPGEVGVVSGLGMISQIEPGVHLVNPLQTITTFSTKTSLLDQENFVPTKEGLTVELDTSVLYRINPKSAREIFETIGPKYEQTIIIPEVSSAVRGLTSESDAKALYSGGGRTLIQNSLKEDLSGRLGERGIIIEDVLLKNLKLPTQLTESIEAKAKAEQESSRMEFVLAKERQEAERKAVEAQGIAEFQRIVSEGISPNLLQWKGIEATEKLAQSPNAKVVIIGNGKDGLPIILGGSEDNKLK
jgi:regulator of protease activity HflC (stomatin/prohibitin superfamily)